jgi:MATE family multidrug resistance protein
MYQTVAGMRIKKMESVNSGSIAIAASVSHAGNKMATMEEAPLLTVTADTEKRAGGDAEGSPWSEVRKQLYLAGPLVAGYLLVNTVQMVSLMFAGHLGELELAGVSVATSFASVTGLSVLVKIPILLYLSVNSLPLRRRRY